ncbi:MAG: DNA polymerase I [Pseudomonadota bacterium]
MTTSPTLIIDGYGFVFRAYHVQPSLTSPNGLEIGALYGFTSMLIKILGDFKPSSIVVVFDYGSKNFRHTLYPDYKANRAPLDDALKSQFPLMRLAAKALGLKVIEQEGVEADDVIATIATKLSLEKRQSIIISSDKDLMQLIGDYTSMYDPMKGKYIKEAEVIEKFGVPPSKVRDALSLMGDKSDNIPGVPSIGPKTAAELVGQFGSLHNLLSNISDIKQEKRRNLMEEHKENALLSWELVGLRHDLEVDINHLEWSGPNREEFANYITEYGFKSLALRAEKLFNTKVQSVEKLMSTDEILADIERSGMLDLSSCDILPLEFIPYLDDISVKKITPCLKSSLKALSLNTGTADLKAFEDLSLMHYAYSAGNEQPEPDYWKEDAITKYIEQKSQLLKNQALSLYYDIDLPLCRLLHDMECNGILVDKKILQDMSLKFATEISVLESKIYELCGCEFNIGSPKQLGEVLFDKMQLPGGKTTGKTQNYSTNVGVLEYLSESGHEVAGYLLKWRELSKLKNTYTDKLPEQINQDTGRIHTTFIQNSTSTGRLSSHNPNLQNIPIRSSYGNEIRKAFIAKNGHLLISADYSQVELRILSHIANIIPMQEAFQRHEDIHKTTASHIFSIPENEITSEHRRKAKGINFGIIYGISAFGLSNQLGISRQEATEYIANYFIKYPGIQNYMTTTKDFASKHGYVCNIFGRKSYLPTIRSTNHAMRGFAERAAINAPIQASAADIAKMAMLRVSEMIQREKFQTKILLQVHDELIFEAPMEEIELVTPLIKFTMENAACLSTNLVVDVSTGSNWGALK